MRTVLEAAGGVARSSDRDETRRTWSVTPVLMRDVIVQFHELQIHAPQYGVDGADDGPHDLIDQLRILVQKAFEVLALKTEHLGVAQGPDCRAVQSRR